MKGGWHCAAVLGGCLLLAGCEREMHDMYRQPRFDADEPTTLFPDGRATRPPPPGSVAVAIGELAATSSGRRGEEALAARAAALAAASAPAPTLARLERGRERYAIVCEPCHGAVGDGDGTVVRRGFPRPPSYHEERLRNAPDRHFFDVIGHGYGVMYSYADRVAPDDRWAIVAYVRALQLSQHAELARLPAPLRSALLATLPGATAAPSATAAPPLAGVPSVSGPAMPPR